MPDDVWSNKIRRESGAGLKYNDFKSMISNRHGEREEIESEIEEERERERGEGQPRVQKGASPRGQVPQI